MPSPTARAPVRRQPWPRTGRFPPTRARGSSRHRRSVSAPRSARSSRCLWSGSWSSPPSRTSRRTRSDLGPIENFPEGEYVIATYLANPSVGEVTRRTAFVRNNGQTDAGEPSFTILYSRCVHLGCPVQPNGPIDEEARRSSRTASSSGPSSHSRSAVRATAGCTTPRATDRPARRCARWTATRSRSGTAASCSASCTRSAASRERARARQISRYPWSVPGTHVDGIEAWLYPIVPSQVTG